jgi:hypothetical protein
MEDLFITYDLKNYRLETLQGEHLATYAHQGQHQRITNLRDSTMMIQKRTGGILSGNFTYYQGSDVLFYGIHEHHGRWHFRSEDKHLYTLVQTNHTSFTIYDAEGRVLIDIDWTVLMIKRIRARVRFHTSDLDVNHGYALMCMMFPHINSLHILALAPIAFGLLVLLKIWLLDILLPLVFQLVDKVLS